MIEKIRGKVKEIFNLVGSFLARIPAYLIPIVASVVLVIVLCVLVLCLSDKWESCIPSKMVPDYKESDGRVSFFWNDFNFYGIVATSWRFSRFGIRSEHTVLKVSRKAIREMCR